MSYSKPCHDRAASSESKYPIALAIVLHVWPYSQPVCSAHALKPSQGGEEETTLH